MKDFRLTECSTGPATHNAGPVGASRVVSARNVEGCLKSYLGSMDSLYPWRQLREQKPVKEEE